MRRCALTQLVDSGVELVGLVEDAIRRKEETKECIDPDLHSRYRSLVGALLFIAITTRPDVQYAAGMLSRCVAYPTPEMLKEAAKKGELRWNGPEEAAKGLHLHWSAVLSPPDCHLIDADKVPDKDGKDAQRSTDYGESPSI